MKIHLISDLHLDHGDLHDVLPLPACNLRVVAGDICEAHHIQSIAIPFLRHMASGGEPVVLVLGNHDHYRGTLGLSATTYERRVATWRNACAEVGVKLLERDAIIVCGRRILGCTWWSAIDWLEPGEHAHRAGFPSDLEFVRHSVKIGITDFRVIRGWTINDHIRRHADDSTWLAEELAKESELPPIVITHFLPHRAAIDDEFAGSSLNAYFTTHRPDLVRQAGAWLFGHTHKRVDVVADGTRLMANPRGYPSEQSGFIPDLVIEV